MPLHPSIQPLQPTGKANIMLYGEPGVGKTRFIGGGPRTLIIRPPTDHTDSIKGGTAKEWVVDCWDDMVEVEEFLRHNPHEFEWAWLDSISLFQDHGLEDIMAQVEAAKPHRRNGPIDQGEYNNNFTRIAKWVRHMVGIPGFNFGMTAHPAEISDNLGNVKLRPWIQGKNMSFKLCGYMNIVAYMQLTKDKDGNERRVLRFRETETYTAKDQFDMFSNYRLVDPTMAKLLAAMPKQTRGPKPAKRTIRRSK